jgi:hypothetical protein
VAKQDVTVELFYSSAWHDHTTRVYTRDPIEITRGRGDEQGEPTPGAATLTLSNMNGDLVDGRYDPRNPSSDLYGLIGRNTPIRITNGGSVRFVGEVASWRPRPAIKGDAWTEVTAKGVLHRLGQGAAPLRSAAFREVVRQTATGVVAYWHGEDGSDSSSLAGGLSGMTPMRIVGGSPSLGSSRVFPGSAPCIDMGAAPTPVLHGRCPVSADTGTLKFRMFAAFPAAGLGSDQILADIYTRPGTGTIRLWRLIYGSAFGGTLKLQGLDNTFAVVEDSGGFGFAIDGQTSMLGFEVVESGADVDYEIATHYLQADGTEVPGIGSGTFTAQTVGIADEVYIGSNAGLVDVALGHIIVGNDATTVDGLESAFTGWITETVSDRLERLCEEEGIPFITNDIGDSMPAGPQPVDTLVGQFAECERTDGGMLYETRDARGLTYRTRSSLYSVDPVLVLDFTGVGMAAPIEPDIDDQNVRNDVTVSNRDGTTARAVQVSGTLNTQDPEDDPDGVGIYATQYDVNLHGEENLTQLATFRRHLGTAPDTRYPSIPVDLDAAPELVEDVDAFDIGDVLAVDNLEADRVKQLVPGYSEVIGSHRRVWTANCIPARPYDVAILNDDVLGRLDTDGSELAAGITSAATSLSVAVTAGPLWTTDAGEVPFDIRVGGEVMTVTAVAGASSPQTFTVSRSANGVVKSHASGAPVNVAHPVVIGL